MLSVTGLDLKGEHETKVPGLPPIHHILFLVGTCMAFNF